MSLFEELKRRNVFRVAVAYIVASWVVLQVADLVMDAINAPDWVLQAMLFFVVLGFFAAVIVAWAYEITPEGIKRESEVTRDQSITRQTAAKLDRLTIALLVVVVAVVIVERNIRVEEPPSKTTASGTEQEAAAQPAPTAEPAKTMAPNSVAVLPFVPMSSGQDDEYFADGLTEEILNSLAQLPELLVTARTSSFSFKGPDTPPVTEIAETLGVAHIVEGSVRRSGDRLRVTAQLVRAADGFHLWSENYDSTSADTIQVQEDIAEKIAVALDVVMNDTKREAMRRAGLRNVDAFILMQKADSLYGSAHGSANQDEMLGQANELYDQVLELVPDNAYAYYQKSDRFLHILSDDASGFYPERHSEAELAEAKAEAIEDLSKAAERARDFSQENDISIDLAYAQGQLTGIGSRIDRFIDEDNCEDPNWLPAVALGYGYAEGLAKRYREIRNCDPLRSLTWMNEVRALTWAGQADEAVRVARQGMETAPGTWLAYSLTFALIAKGQFEEARDAITRFMENRDDVLSFNGNVLAAQGEKEAAEEMFAEVGQRSLIRGDGPGEFWDLMNNAQLGNRDQANQLASTIDQHTFGPQTLLLAVLWCHCGSPFDLETTPNFAAMIRDAGFSWSLASPIKWPLKDW